MPSALNGPSPRPRSPRLCNQERCEKPVSAREMCAMHAQRVRRYGDPNATPRFNRDPNVRFWSKVDVGHPAGCWWWIGKDNGHGYGVFMTGSGAAKTSRSWYAHRWAYEYLIGPIPEGMQIDHLCQNRRCCNPDHLEVVTPAENTRRNSLARRTHCKFGHRMAGDNVYRQPSTGRRSCLACRRLFRDAPRTRENYDAIIAARASERSAA